MSDDPKILDPVIGVKLNQHLRISDANPPGYLPLWTRVRPATVPGSHTPQTLRTLSASTVVASAHLPSLKT